MPKRSSSKNKKNKKISQSPVSVEKSTNMSDIQQPQQPQAQSQTSNTRGVKKTMSDIKTPSTNSKSGNEKTKPDPEKFQNPTQVNPIAELLKDEANRARIYAVLFGVLFVAITIGIVFVGIPSTVKQTDDYKAIEERAKQADEKAKKDAEAAEAKKLTDQRIAEENTVLTRFDNLSTTMSTNYGDIVIDLKYDTAPATVENFARLSFRGFYKDQSIHRMVLTDGFNVIQGGQPKSGQSNEAALGGTVLDELWSVAPEFASDESGNQALSNTPILKEPSLAKDLDLAQGTILYPKGTILMAKSSQPNSATTQFFITLTDTRLPAQYTIFGVVKQDSFGTLDKIFKDVKPQESQSTKEGYQDGAPSPAITYSITLDGYGDKK